MSINREIPLRPTCDQVIGLYSLLQHPFYVAWRDGSLPVAALTDYAREYGAFIETISGGWQTVGQPEIAKIEREHAVIWNTSFAAGLGTSVAPPEVPQVASLVDTSLRLFADRATALGGLYAFEAQQPQTALTKLMGLKEHYTQLPSACGDYFELHRDDYDEPALLAREIEALPEVDRDRATKACETMSRALYDGLSGIHEPYTI